jgi:hypothetical protein
MKTNDLFEMTMDTLSLVNNWWGVVVNMVLE